MPDIVNLSDLQPVAQQNPDIVDLRELQPVSATLSQPPSNGLSDFMQGAYETTLQGTGHALMHPIDTIDAIGHGMVQQGDEARKSLHDVFTNPAATPEEKQQAIVEAIPLIGPMIKRIDDLQAQGKTSEAYGQQVGLLASLLGPKVLGKAVGPAADVIEAASKKVSPRVSGMMNQYVGLNYNDLPKYERLNPGSPEEIGNTVYKEAGLKNNLPAQKTAIDDAIKSRLNDTSNIIQHADKYAHVTDVHHLLLDRSLDLLDQLDREGAPDVSKNAVGKALEGLSDYSKTMKPSEMLEMRNNIKPKSFDTSTSNVEERLRQNIYHALNDSIEQSLNPQDAVNFRLNNRTVNRLIIAANAAAEKLTKGQLKGQGPISSVLKDLDLKKVGNAVVSAVPPGADLKAAIVPRQAASSALASGANAVRQFGPSAAPGLARYTRASLLVPEQEQVNQ